MALIYCAGPYSARTDKERIDNVNAAIAVAISLRLRGHQPFIPHLMHYVDEISTSLGINLGYENYMAWGESFQRVCDGFYYIKSSPGANRELALAKKLGQIIFYSMDIVPFVKQEVA